MGTATACSRCLAQGERLTATIWPLQSHWVSRFPCVFAQGRGCSLVVPAFSPELRGSSHSGVYPDSNYLSEQTTTANLF